MSRGNRFARKFSIKFIYEIAKKRKKILSKLSAVHLCIANFVHKFSPFKVARDKSDRAVIKEV